MTVFTDLLLDIRKGRVVSRATERMAELVEAVTEHGKAGKLTLELTVKPQKNDPTQVVIVPAVKVKMPDGDLPDAIFFVGEGGELLRDDPTQEEMFPRRDLGDRADHPRSRPTA